MRQPPGCRNAQKSRKAAVLCGACFFEHLAKVMPESTRARGRVLAQRKARRVKTFTGLPRAGRNKHLSCETPIEILRGCTFFRDLPLFLEACTRGAYSSLRNDRRQTPHSSLPAPHRVRARTITLLQVHQALDAKAARLGAPWDAERVRKALWSRAMHSRFQMTVPPIENLPPRAATSSSSSSAAASQGSPPPSADGKASAGGSGADDSDRAKKTARGGGGGGGGGGAKRHKSGR